MRAFSFGKRIIIAMICAGILVACSNEPEVVVIPKERIFKGFPVLLDSVIRTPEGMVRGVELGDSVAKISKLELNKPEETDTEYMLYSYKGDTSNTYTVAYSFAKDTISEIEIQINIKICDSVTGILEGIKKYYSAKYAEPLMDKGIYVFNCMDSKKRNFTISITDNSTSETGILSILYYREEE